MSTEALDTPYLHYEDPKIAVDGWVVGGGLSVRNYRWSTLTANEAIGTGYIVGDCNYAPVWAHRYVEHWTDVELSCSAIRRADQSARIFFGAR
jgi:hypothetical protein